MGCTLGVRVMRRLGWWRLAVCACILTYGSGEDVSDMLRRRLVSRCVTRTFRVPNHAYNRGRAAFT